MGVLGPRATVLAHITDSHVAPGGRRTAVLKDKSVEILGDILGQVNGADAILFGGDNIDNRNGEDEMEAFLGLLRGHPSWLCIVGNHEARNPKPGSGVISKDTFARYVAGHGISPGRFSFSERVGNVRVIGIDTTLVGSTGGFVFEPTLSFLARELRTAEEDHIVVLGHHLLAAPWAPYRLDVWDAEYMVHNREVVISLLATCPKVRAYLCGHHHASRIHRIAGRGEGGGFYHIATASPAAYPHAARILRFEDHAVVVEMLRPRIEGLIDEGLASVMTGRKVERYKTLGSPRAFRDYVAGRATDNEAILPYESARASSRVSMIELATSETLSPRVSHPIAELTEGPEIIGK